MSCWPYQPLPISTGQSGLDRCGNVVLYTAPTVTHARACWPCGIWPIPTQWCWTPPLPHPWPPASGCAGCLPSGLAAIMTSGSAMAQWMISQPKPVPRALPTVKVA